MVAAGQDHFGAGSGQPDQGVVQQAHDVHARQGAVVHVAGDQDHVNSVFRDGADKLVDEGPLGVQHPDAMERPAQMPVRCVQ